MNTDQVTFVVEGGTYSLTHSDHATNLCNSSGTVANFGGNWLRLTPTSRYGKFQCDTLHVPQGRFDVAFKGDSLLIGPETLLFTRDTSAYFFQLTLR